MDSAFVVINLGIDGGLKIADNEIDLPPYGATLTKEFSMPKKSSALTVMKNLIIGLIVLLVVIVGAGIFLGSNLDQIIKTAVEKYGSEATQTTVSLGGVKLAITSGEGALSNFSVGNPSGFSSADAMKIEGLSVKVDAKSIAGKGPIMINEVTIDGPQVNYEAIADGSSNLQAIQKNAEKYAGADKAEAKKEGESAKEEEGRKIIIKDFYVRNGKVSISHELLKDKKLEAQLPAIHLTNVGKASGGATAAQVAEQLLGSITEGAIKAATDNLAGELKGAVEEKVKDAVGDQLEKVGIPTEGLFGK